MISVLRKLLTVFAIGVVFLLGMVTTVYLSLRSPIVNVPDIVGKDRFVAENELTAAGLNFRVRAARPSRQVKADTVMFQLPRAGESVKAGQTVAVDIARVPKEGEASETVVSTDNSNTSTTSNSSASSNENKPKRNKNANANANGNANNGNANGTGANGNRNTNTTRANANVKPNSNVSNDNEAVPRVPSANRTPQTDNGNANRANRNVNRTPTPARPAPPKPTPPGNR